MLRKSLIALGALILLAGRASAQTTTPRTTAGEFAVEPPPLLSLAVPSHKPQSTPAMPGEKRAAWGLDSQAAPLKGWHSDRTVSYKFNLVC